MVEAPGSSLFVLYMEEEGIFIHIAKYAGIAQKFAWSKRAFLFSSF